MDTQKILEEFCRLTGLNQEDAAGYSSLVELANQEVLQNLKPGADTTLYESVLIELAASTAYGWYLTLYDNPVQQVSVMDVSIQAGGQQKISQAKKMREELIRMCRAIWKDSDFLFRAV